MLCSTVARNTMVKHKQDVRTAEPGPPVSLGASTYKGDVTCSHLVVFKFPGIHFQLTQGTFDLNLGHLKLTSPDLQQ